MIDLVNLDTQKVSCSTCRANCCRLEVMLIDDNNVPPQYIAIDQWGAETMKRLNDGWCAALDRETFLCRIYEDRPWICREFELGSPECLEERSSSPVN